MALTTLPYPSLDFVPLDILTAEEMNQIVANYTAINNATIGTNQLANNSITTPKLANKAVTSDKVDWATFPSSGLTADGSNTTSGIGTVYYKRILPNVYLLWGNITPTVEGGKVALPHRSALPDNSQVFTLYGSLMNSTKAFISNTDPNYIGFTKQTTGNTYALWGVAFLNDNA